MRKLVIIVLSCLVLHSLGQIVQISKFSNLSIDSMGDLKWTIGYHEEDGFDVDIEKFQNSRWHKVTGLSQILLRASKETMQSNLESTKMTTHTHTSRVKFHKGTNIYRLVMTRPDKIISEEVKLISSISNDDGSIWIVDNKIILDEIVQYEILNSDGATLTNGEAKVIDVSILPTGSYFFYTKTSTKQFTK
jgi:hypothetical protein